MGWREARVSTTTHGDLPLWKGAGESSDAEAQGAAVAAGSVTSLKRGRGVDLLLDLLTLDR